MSENESTMSENENAVASGKSFYVVSLNKFLVLFIATFGAYSVYWHYKNWSCYRKQSGANISPVGRAILSVFYVNSLFDLIKVKGESITLVAQWHARWHAVTLIALMLTSQIFDALSRKNIGSPYTDFASLATLILLAVCYYKAQIIINSTCDDALGLSNKRFTWANYVWIFIGAIVWLLALTGFFLPE